MTEPLDSKLSKTQPYACDRSFHGLGKRFGLFAGIIAIVSTQAMAAKFPIPEWDIAADIKQQMASSQCRDFDNYTFAQWGKESRDKTIQTDGVILIKGGVIRYEKYYDPIMRKIVTAGESPAMVQRNHILWSASKSVTAALTGVAIQEGRLSLDTKLSDARFFPRDSHFPVQDVALYNQVTVRDLLEMGAGFQWSESYESNPKDSSVTKMLYLEGAGDMTKFALQQAMIPEGPGKIWNYSSGNVSIMMAMLKKAYEQDPSDQYGDGYHGMPWRSLFAPLGMQNAAIEVDGAGVFVGSSYAHMRPRDMARLGYLYLREGKWGNRQLLPPSWVRESVKTVQPYLNVVSSIKDPTADGVFGRSWWLNRAEGSNAKPYPDVADDFYGAFGHYGQYIFAIPSEDTVVVRVATDRDPHLFDVNKWLVYAKKCLQ